MAVTVSGGVSAGTILSEDGTATAPSIAFAGDVGTGLRHRASASLTVSSQSQDQFEFAANTFRLRSDGSIGWSSGIISTGVDTQLFRDVANILAQRNGTNAQTFRLYNTFTDASNYERLGLTWASNVVTLKAEALGTGTQRRIDIVGTATNDAAAAGAVGELITATAAPAAVSLSTGTSANVISVSLTAGDWDCTGTINFTFGATTSITNLTGGVSSTSATLPTQDATFDYETAAQVPTAGKVASYPVPVTQLLLAATTTVYLVVQATFTVSTLTAGGTLRCRRMR